MPRYPWSVSFVAACALASSATRAQSAAWPEAPLEIVVNSQGTGRVIVVLRESASSIWVETKDLHALRLRTPAATPRVVDGLEYYPLSAIAGMTLEIDERSQRARVQVPPQALESGTILDVARLSPALTPASGGAFVNYELSAQRVWSDDSAGGFAKLGLFGPYGVFTSSGVMRADGGSTEAVRLDSTFTVDFPERLETLDLGDTVSTPGNWGDAVRFAGVHWGTNFGIRPDLITTPLLSASGAAVIPSTVDVLVNDQRVSSASVAPGPFVIANIPPLSGAGDVSVVIRDALGREQLISQPFYSSPALLAAGLSQYSLDFGRIREDYGLDSDHYGPAVGALTLRRGITDAFTLEEHAEFQEHDAHAAGLDAAMRTGSLGVLTLTAAAGGAAGSSGWLYGVGFEHHADLLSLTASALFASDGFRQVGDSIAAALRFERQTLLQAGLNLRRAGSLSIAWVQQSYAAQPASRTVSLSDYVAFGASGALALTVSRAYGTAASTSLYLSFTCALGARETASVGAQAGRGADSPQDEALATLSQSAPAGPGHGYRLSASSSGDYDADWRQQLATADIEVEAASRRGVSGQSALLAGTLSWLDGRVYAARSTPQSFAAVDVGLPDIPVYLENQPVARTDASGTALLPTVIPYVANRVSVEPTDLPLDTSIDARTITITPQLNSGVVVRFPVERVHAGVFRLVTDDGRPVPAGATVQFNLGSFPVALDGAVYVTTFDRGASGHAEWPGGECRFRVDPPPRNDPLPDMGTIACRTGETTPPQ